MFVSRWINRSATHLVLVAALVSTLAFSVAPLTAAQVVTATIKVGSQPDGIAVDAQANRIYVSNAGDKTVSVIDGRSHAVVATIAIDGVPGDVAVNPNTKRVYVVSPQPLNVPPSPGSQKVSVVDGDSNRVVATFPITYSVGSGQVELAVNPITNRVFVANGVPQGVLVVDGQTNSAVATIGLPGAPMGLAVNPATNRLYVTTWEQEAGGVLSVFDAGSAALVSARPGDSGAARMAVDPVASRLYVGNTSGVDVDVLDAASASPIINVPFAEGNAGMVGVAFNPTTGHVFTVGFVGATNRVHVLDGSSGRVVASFDGIGGYGKVAVNPVTNRVYVTNPDAGTVAVLDDAAIAMPAAAGIDTSAMDYDVPNGHFYRQANGQGGAGDSGFAITNDDGIPFWTWLNRFGGVRAVGYPVSHRFRWQGNTVQVFQKAVFQWQPASRKVVFANVFDELSAAGKDGWLDSVRAIPPLPDWSNDKGKPDSELFRSHIGLLDPYPSLKQAAFSDEAHARNGLIMAVRDGGETVTVRAQRRVLQLSKAAPGQVTVANGGEVAKEAGLYPEHATTPRAWLSSTDIQSRLQAMIGAKYAQYQKANNLPQNAGVLVYLLAPSGTWFAAAGLPDGVDENWHYRIASVSKTFTAAAIMLLDQQGKLKIDDVLTATMPGQAFPYLPDSPNYAIPYKSQITIRQLLSHRAGVFDVFNNAVPASSGAPYAGQTYQAYVSTELNEPDHQFTQDELIGVLASNRLSFSAPDAAYHYSDTGYTLLAKIVERVSGKSYDRFLADNFLRPIGLTQTSAPWSAYDSLLPSPFLVGHVSLGEGFSEYVEDNMSSQIGPGNVISTPSDIARWLRAILSGRGPLTREQIVKMTAVPAGNATYALGIGNSAVGMGHSGAHPGYVNLVGYNPEDDVAVAVVTPFIDYTKLPEHLALITEIGKEAREIAGYPGTWPK